VMRIKINGNSFDLYPADEAVKLDDDIKKPLYIYGEYSEEFLDALYLIHGLKRPTAVIVSCNLDNLNRLLRHTNIFHTFTFTVVPDVICEEAYEKMYDFLMFSPMSTSYVTWLSSLMLSTTRQITDIDLDGKKVFYGQCSKNTCPLAIRGCSKGVLFSNLFYPGRQTPVDSDFEKFCNIQRKFSEKIARDVTFIPETELEVFRNTRQSLGIQNQFWIDPYGIY